ncbi:MAG: hypothetical protein MJZ81_07670 [Bacteroidales bacterium]|nr:hypothetical protein [Bacteroidales bacterium]
MRLNIDACVAIEKEYGKAGDRKADPFIRALEEIARNVELDSNDMLKIAEEVRNNEIKFNKGGAK